MKKKTCTILTVSSLALVGLAVLPAGPVEAFPFLRSWHESASGETNQKQNRAGAGGLYGTGGPHEKGIECSHCHIGGEEKIGVTITASPPWNKVGNDEFYKPGQTYAITVEMTGEHKGLDNKDMNGNVNLANNLNGFAMSFENPSGAIMGKLTPDYPGAKAVGFKDANCPTSAPQNNPAGTTYAYGDCHGVVFVPQASKQPALTKWDFSWTAPAAGTGEIKAWYGVVDGDTHGSSSLNDDVIQGARKLLEDPN